MRTIIAGSRSADCYLELESAIRKCGWQITKVVSGMARGADRLGVRYARDRGLPCAHFPADWLTYGKRAGYLRNEKMAEHAEALIALWDGSSPGTKHMIDIARARGLRIHIEYIL